MARRLNEIERAVFVCTGSKCKDRGGKQIYEAAKHVVRRLLGKNAVVARTKCTGNCKYAPVFTVQPDNCWSGEMGVQESVAALEKQLQRRDRKRG